LDQAPRDEGDARVRLPLPHRIVRTIGFRCRFLDFFFHVRKIFFFIISFLDWALAAGCPQLVQLPSFSPTNDFRVRKRQSNRAAAPGCRLVWWDADAASHHFGRSFRIDAGRGGEIFCSGADRALLFFGSEIWQMPWPQSISTSLLPC